MKILGLLLALPVIGCAGVHSSVGNTNGRPAVTQEDRRLRALRVARPLLEGWDGPTVTVCVLTADGPAAYAWRDGHVFVTRGLVDLLGDSELAAAIAHELGHLSARPGRRVVSLSGNAADIEAAADATGVRTLRAHGLPAGAMEKMLRKVMESGTLSAECRGAIGRRIEILGKSGEM